MSKIETFLFHAVSSKWPNDRLQDRQTPPLTNDTLRLRGVISDDPNDDTVVSLLNDGFEIWFGYPHKWTYHISRKHFHRILRWYIWRCIWGEWFGTRRKLYYFLLRRQVNKHKEQS